MSEPTADDVRRAIFDAQEEIRAALFRLTQKLPDGYMVTGTQVGCRAQSVAGGGHEYLITANITVEVTAGYGRLT